MGPLMGLLMGLLMGVLMGLLLWADFNRPRNGRYLVGKFEFRAQIEFVDELASHGQGGVGQTWTCPKP